MNSDVREKSANSKVRGALGTLITGECWELWVTRDPLISKVPDYTRVFVHLSSLKLKSPEFSLKSESAESPLKGTLKIQM